jgi:hypothetical protein
MNVRQSTKGESMKFRKKPVVIEAIQFVGPESIATMKDAWGEEFNKFTTVGTETAKVMPISTLEGVMNACVGDWVIKGVKGEFYPCRADIFALSYDPAESSSSS